MRTTALLLLATLVLVPLAESHVTNLPQSANVNAGPYRISYILRPDPPYAENPVGIAARVYESATGRLREDLRVEVELSAADFTATKKMEPDGTGYLLAGITPPRAANHSLEFHVWDPGASAPHTGASTIDIYPNLPIRVRPVDDTFDVFVGQTLPLAFEMVDPITIARKDTFDDLTIRMEHWGPSHIRLLDADEVLATEVTPGVWRIDYKFENSGMYHIRFASAGGAFNYDDVPLLHVNADEPFTQEPEDTPGPAIALVLVALGILALLRKR